MDPFLFMILWFCFVWEVCVGVFYNPVSYLWKYSYSIPFLLPYSYCSKDVYNKENLFNSLNYDVAAKKRKKDILNSKTKTQCKPFVLHIRRKVSGDIAQLVGCLPRMHRVLGSVP